VQIIQYSRAKLAFMALLCALGLPVVGIMLLFTVNPIGAIMGIVCLIAGPIGGLVVMIRLVLGGAAVAFDDRQVRVTTLWRSRSVPWSQVESVALERTTFYVYGFIPVNKTHHLNVKLVDGFVGTKKLSIALNVLAVSVEEAEGMVRMMEQARSGALPMLTGHAKPAIPARAADPLMGAPRDANFDADAAIARYLAGASRPLQNRVLAASVWA
jgi:hypothetical protein